MHHELAGKPVPIDKIVNIPRLITEYFQLRPDPEERDQRVRFGTSGHRGVSSTCSFNDHHVAAISQAVCEVRRSKGIDGPLYLGKDTHALSEAAFATSLEVFAGNGIDVIIQKGFGYTPTPVISHAILTHNKKGDDGTADGVVITPSHNPPEFGGYKYNPPEAGPADTETTLAIERRANEILSRGLNEIKRIPFARARKSSSIHEYDFTVPYVEDLQSVLDLDAVRNAGISIGVDPMGGSGIDFWDPIAEIYGLSIDVVNRRVDPTFSFMALDHDGKIRMDCSSPYAMANLIGLKDAYDIAFGNDPDYDRHGIVTRSSGLMNPNHYLSVAIWYLFQHRTAWSQTASIGKTLVSSSMIDRIADHLGRRVTEVPVGFKWLVSGLFTGSFGFGGEESAGASFLRKDGTVWTTDKDGILLDLLAAEITAVSGRDPGVIYDELTERFGTPYYERIDVPATPGEKHTLKNLEKGAILSDTMADEPILDILTHAPGNDAPIGGLKVRTENGWFAARPSGTEDIYKIYAESFKSVNHLKDIQHEARNIVRRALEASK